MGQLPDVIVELFLSLCVLNKSFIKTGCSLEAINKTNINNQIYLKK